jgi:hypothetical protein
VSYALDVRQVGGSTASALTVSNSFRLKRDAGGLHRQYHSELHVYGGQPATVWRCILHIRRANRAPYKILLAAYQQREYGGPLADYSWAMAGRRSAPACGWAPFQEGVSTHGILFYWG